MSDVRHICFDEQKYDSEAQMFKDVFKVLQILIRNEYKCSIEFEDCGIYTLRFDDKDEDIAEYRLTWKKVKR